MTDTPAPPAAQAAAPPQTNSPFHQGNQPDRADFKPIPPSAPPTPPRISDAEFEALSPMDRLAYARQFSASPTPGDRMTTPAQPEKSAGYAGNQGTADVRLVEAPEGGQPTIKIGDAQFTEQQLRDLATFKVSEDSRKASLPADPSGYELKLPADLKLPEGVAFRFDDTDPILGPSLNAVRAWAHANFLDQTKFEQLLGLYAGARAHESAQVAEASKPEREKLGAAGPARVGAINTWLDAQGVPGLKGRMWTAQDVSDFEKLLSRFTSQGGSTFTASGRDPGDRGGMSDEQWSRLSYAEKVDYARTHQQPQPNGRGRQ